MGCVKLWRRSFEHGVGITDPHPLEEQLAYFENRVLPENDVRIALLDAELVGFLAFTTESITQLYVDVSHLRRGIGTQLLAVAKRQSSGCLWLYTFARNTNARAFYEHHGFLDVGHGFENMWNLEDVKYVWSRNPGAT